MKITFLLILILMISGCSANVYHAANVTLHSVRNLNIAENNHATAIRVHIYQLKKTLPFKMLSYADLESAPYKLLGDSLVDKSDYYVRPNVCFKEEIDIQAGVQYIAVTAGFHHTRRKDWRAIMRIPQPALPWLAYIGFYKHLNLTIDLHRDSLLLNP